VRQHANDRNPSREIVYPPSDTPMGRETESMGHIDLSILGRPGPLWWLAFLVAVGVAAFAYFRLGAPLGRGWRTVLRVARGATLLLLLFLLLEPILTLRAEETGRPRLSVLIDRSSSMGLPGSTGGTRSAEAARVVAELEAGLADRFQLEWLGFAQGVEPRPADRGPYPWAPLGVTAMGDALEETLLRHGDHPVSGLVLVTDGVQTRGKDPEQVARNVPVPVFGVVIGDTLAPPDLLVRQVRAQPVGFAGEPLAFRVVLTGQGLEGRSATVTIRERSSAEGGVRPAGADLSRQTITLPSESGRETEVALEALPPRVGLILFEVEARVEGGEAVTRNNTRYVAVDIREKKTRVLYIECAPDWDFSFLKRTCDADTSLAYTYLVRSAPGRWVAYGARTGARMPVRDDDLAAYAAVVVGHAAPEDLPAETARLLYRFAQGGGGVLFVGAASSGDLESWREIWEDQLPIQLLAEPRRGFAESPVGVGLAGLAHEITVVDESPVATEEAWAALPPVLVPEGTYVTTHGAITLLTAHTTSPAREVPVLAIAQLGAGRVGVMTARGFWRWDLTKSAARSDLPLAREFWRRVMRWLSEPSQTDRFLARPLRLVFQDSEPLVFTARLADEAYEPVAGARVRIEIEQVAPLAAPEAGAGSTEVPASGGAGLEAPQEGRVLEAALYPEGPVGQYAATLAPMPPGMYRFRALATRPDDRPLPVPQTGGYFWVEPMGPEFFDLGASRRLPALLAGASGGTVVAADHVLDLVDAVPERYKPVRIVRQAELWNHWAVFLALGTLLCAEWIVRRRKGLA
jgi:hypothetical protein